MVPLDPDAAGYVQSWLGEPRRPGPLDLHHALAYHRQGLWGDDARSPRSVLLVREAGGRLEAFGAGEPGPAVAWLSRRAGRLVSLLAPEDWWDAVERRVEGVERVEIQVLSAEAADLTPASSAVVVRRLTAEDEATFRSEVVPEWALFGWKSFRHLIEHGAGFVVPFGAGYAALAWVYSQAGPYDAIGVSTVPRFRRLGLGRAAGSALVLDVVNRRRKIPIWTADPANEASLALARALGFSASGTEMFLRWQPSGAGGGSPTD